MSASGKWNFHELTGRGGGGVISSEARSLGVGGEARLDRAIDHLRQLERTNWNRPTASCLGNHIYVIRLKDQSLVQRRVFGHFHAPHEAFVMTLLGHEKDNVYYPHDYEPRAQQHKTDCDADFQGRTRAFRDYCVVCQPPGNGQLAPSAASSGQKRAGAKNALA
jgi:hypothetical protein